MVNKFYETGSVHDNRALVWAKWSVHKQERQEEVRWPLTENPHTFITHLLQQLGVSLSTTYRIVWEYIVLFLYKVHVAQKLILYSKERWLNFTLDFTAALALKTSMLNNIWFTDECHFWLNGHVNEQNMWLWAENDPYKIEEVPLHLAKMTVWVAFTSCGIIGPVFIREIVTPESYHSLLANDIIPELENWG